MTLWKPGWFPTVKLCDLWVLQMTASTSSVFHLCLWSFAVKSSPTALQWLSCFIFEEAYVTARVPFLEWKPFRLGIKKENNFYRIRNSTVYRKNALLSINQIITLKKLLWSSKMSFAFVLWFWANTESYIVPTEDFLSLLSSSCPVSPFPCWVPPWELQHTLGITEACRRQDNRFKTPELGQGSCHLPLQVRAWKHRGSDAAC